MNLPSNSNVPTHSQNADFVMSVMNYVALAFGITAVGTYFAPQILPPNFPYLLIFVLELGLVFTARWWSQWNRPVNILMFIGFAFLSGLTLYPLLNLALALPGGSQMVMQALLATIVLAFAAGMYARTTKRDLSGMGGFLMMALIGLIVVSVIQMFWFNSMMELIISGVGIVLFSAFIAYDIQMIQRYEKNRALEAALGLYLSIFNLFTSILRFLIAMRSN